MLELRTSTAISISKEQQRGVGSALILKVSLAHHHFFQRAIGAVCVSRREVCEDFGPVNAPPQKGAVRKLVVAAPRKFLGQEILDTCRFDNLR